MPRKQKHPMALRQGDRANFKTLERAWANGDVCLASSTLKSTGEKVALICAVCPQGDDMLMVPLAQMVAGNPYELYTDPTAD